MEQGADPSARVLVHHALSHKGSVYGVNFAHGGRLRSELYIDGGDPEQNMELFRAIHARRTELETVYGAPLHWEELPGKQACRVADYAAGDAANVDEHEAYIDWFFDSSDRLREAIKAVAPSISSGG